MIILNAKLINTKKPDLTFAKSGFISEFLQRKIAVTICLC